jgi:hypothetical protein
MLRLVRSTSVLAAFFVFAFTFAAVSAQDKTTEPEAEQKRVPGEQAAEPAQEKPDEKEAKLTKYLSGAKFVGKFTVDGKENKTPKTEEYTISKCEKLPEPDMYRLTARIVYGDVNQEVPLDLKILWAGRTPVITMDQFWIPGMGTFGARVLIHPDRYSGTWQHDEVGGHLYGKIVTKAAP